jgi:hypothetical protein
MASQQYKNKDRALRLVSIRILSTKIILPTKNR